MRKIRSIGVALAAYRPNVEYFAEQLATIRAQSFCDWVCVITFDSPMGNILVHELVAPHAQDSRFEWIENPSRLGHKRNFGKAIQTVAAKGVDAIAFADQDDRWYPQKLSRLAEALAQTPALSLVQSDMHVLDAGGLCPGTSWAIDGRNVANCLPGDLVIRNMVTGCASLMDSELARRYPSIPDAVGYHDHWYGLAAAAHGGIYPVDEALFAYRQHGANVFGVTPRRSLGSYLGRIRDPLRVVRNARTAWLATEGLLEAARAAGMPLGDLELGWGALLGSALRHVNDDRALAASSAVEALGKLVSWTPRSRRPAMDPVERPSAPVVRGASASMEAPRVSIIVRTYAGREGLLSQCLSSLAAQSHRPLEVVVVEDGAETARAAVAGLSADPGLSWVYAAVPKQGRSGAGNAGLALATGDLLGFLDDDDLLSANHVELLVALLANAPQAPAAYARALEVETEFTPGSWLPYREVTVHDPMPHAFRREALWVANFLPIQSVLFRRSAYLAQGGFCTELEALEDWDLWQRVALLGDFAYLPRITSRYRVPANVALRPERSLAIARHYQAALQRQEHMGQPSVASRRRAARLRAPFFTTPRGLAVLDWFAMHPWAYQTVRRLWTLRPSKITSRR
jgi:glycosyltransferase involved in cell wall biosynthesis